MSQVKKVAIAAAAILALPVTAHANEAYVFGSIGNSQATHSIERNIGANPPVLPVADTSGTTTAEDSGRSYQFGAGYEFDLRDGKFFVGAEAYYGFEDTDTRNINGVLITDVDLDARYGGRLLSGINVTDRFAFFSHVGVAWVDFDLTNGYTFDGPVTERSETETALTYGVGVRYDLTDNISAVVDYTRVDDIDFGGIPEVAGNTGRVNPNRLSLDTIATGLRFKF